MNLTNYLQEITQKATGSVKMFISGRYGVTDCLEGWTTTGSMLLTRTARMSPVSIPCMLFTRRSGHLLCRRLMSQNGRP
jgi:hypothetical protein